MWSRNPQHEYAYKVDIKLIPFEICLIHKPTHLDSYLEMILSNSNHLSKFKALVVIVAFTTKDNRHISNKDRTASRVNTQPFSEYFIVRTRIIVIF